MEPARLGHQVLEPAAGRLLVAAPMLPDPNFTRSIVLLHDVDDGVLGVVLNRPGEVRVADVLPDWSAVVGAPDVLFAGGPVDAGSALGVARLRHRPADPAAAPVGWRRVLGDTGLLDLDTPAELVAPALADLRVYAGYAGWSRGQLQGEIDEGAWYVVDGEPGDGFATDPAALWRRVLARQRGDLAWLATYPADPTLN